MKWYQQIQFISAVAMPEEYASAYETTINGMWAAPELRKQQMVEESHGKGRYVLFSVPLIALTPQVYEKEEHRSLIEEACRDIEGNPSLVPWYYWEKKPVYSLCFYSSAFRRYLLDRIRDGIDRGMDVVNLDEINTNLGLMNREAGGSGFCASCLDRFKRHLKQETAGQYAELADASDELLRQRLRKEDELYGQYRRFHEKEAFGVVVDFIKEIRAVAQECNPHFAITANVAYLGNHVIDHGDLWGPIWGEQLDFMMMENIYQPDPDGPHLLLPRGKFTAWYRLGSAVFSQTPVWICPSILVPKQFASEKRIQYYLLMFVEAYANGGRWGYYWWPGVDVETRLKATAPEQLKDYICFIGRYRNYFEQVSTQNELAILYLNSSVRERPESHFKYIALAQALAEAGYQYDVIYGGDGIYTLDDLKMERLNHYKAILVPESNHLTDTQAEPLASYSARSASRLVLFTQGQPDPRLTHATVQNENMLFSFWQDYREEDRQRISACVTQYVSGRIDTSDPFVNVIRYIKGKEHILHFINYNYEPDRDKVSTIENLSVHVHWEGSNTPEIRWLSLYGEQQLPSKLTEGKLEFEIPGLDLYGMAILC